MSETEVITLLKEQNARLLTILEKFAEKDINIVVNSYNGASASSSSSLDDSEEHKEKISHVTNSGQHNTTHTLK